MHTLNSNRNTIVSKVPQVTLAFWVVKILATTLGETGGDAVTMSWLGETTSEAKATGYLIGTGIFGVIFIVAVLVQIRAKKFHPFLYWLTIVATTTVGTTLADREHIDRNGEYAEGRDFLLGDDHVLPDPGDGAWRLGGRHK